MSRMPKKLVAAVLRAAEINWEKNNGKFKDLDEKQKFALAFVSGYETAWSVYTDEDENEEEKDE